MEEYLEIGQIVNTNGLKGYLKVKDTDMGKVIGKEGRIAKAIRTIMKSIAAKEGKRVNIEFIG